MKTLAKIIILMVILVSTPLILFSARTDNTWQEKENTWLETTWSEGRDILINGLNHYLNFGTFNGSSGYGIRDNSGTIEIKNEGGAWAEAITASSTSVLSLQGVTDNGATTTVFSAFTSGIAVDTDSLYVSGSLNNVGISTTTPSARLTIVNTGTDDSLRIEDTTSDTTPTVLDANGNLGLGVSVPSYKLDIRDASGLDGATPVTTNIYSTNNGTWTDEAIPAQLLFGTADTTGGAGTRGAIKLFADDTSGADNGLSFFTTTSGAGGLTEKLRISHNGNVGIGTTQTESATTNFALSVIGSGLQLLGSDTSTASSTKSFRIGSLHYDNTTNTRPVVGWYMSNDASANTVYLGGGTSAGYAATDFRIYTAADTTTQTGSRRFSIDSTGRSMFGSGTVVGALSVTENRNVTGWTSSALGRSFNANISTLTDTDQTGTIAQRVVNSFLATTLASSNAVTLTSASNVYIAGAPVAGTNTTITQGHALRVASGRTKLDGGLQLAYVAKTGTYTASATADYTIDCTANTFTVNLPTAVGIANQVFVIKNSGTGVITVDANGTETIDGALTYSLNTQYQSVTVQSNGANWIVI